MMFLIRVILLYALQDEIGFIVRIATNERLCKEENIISKLLCFILERNALSH